MKSFPPGKTSRVRLTESLTMARGFSQRVRIHLSRHRHPGVSSCSGRKQWIDILLRLSITLRPMADHGRFALSVGADSARKNSLSFSKVDSFNALLGPQPFLTLRRGRQHCLNHDDREEAHSSYRPWAVGRKSLTHIKIHAGRAFCE